MRGIKVEKEGQLYLATTQEFEKWTGSKFVPKLVFSDEKTLQKIQKKTRKLYEKSSLTKRQIWLGHYFAKEIEESYFPDLLVKWISPEVGWGLFAERPFRKGEFIGEYGGRLRKKKGTDRRNSYCFRYAISSEVITSYTIDAREQGGITRLINHSFAPNVVATFATRHNITHVIFIANKPIPKGTQLLCNYGEDYWAQRKGLRRIEF